MSKREQRSRQRRINQFTEEQFDEMHRWLGPMRKFHHRWEAATELAAMPGDPNGTDRDIVAAAKYQQTMLQCSSDADREKVRTRWAEISQAKAIFDCDDPRKWEIEAWIICEQSDKQIANRCGLSAKVVAVYEKLFCSLREYLHNPEALANKMFGVAIGVKFGDLDLGRFWSYVGLTEPTAALVQVIEAFRAAWKPGTLPVLSVYLSEGVQLNIQALVSMKRAYQGTSLIFDVGAMRWYDATMPRTARATEAGMVYHVLNRGNGRMRIFHKEGDYEAFLRVLSEGLERYPVELFTYCLMPNHWHLVVRPGKDDSLGRWLGWVGVTHVRRYHEHYHSRGGGHLYQGRFKSFPVAEDDYFLTLCRYVEANALRGGIVERVEEWRWSGLWQRADAADALPLAAWPLERPRDWLARVNRDLKEEQLEDVRAAVQRGRPLGADDWVRRTAERLGLEFTLRGPGWPRTKENQ